MSVHAADPVSEALGRISLTDWRLAAIHILLIGAVLSPMIWAEYPPLVDYPNHLARIHVLATLDQNPHLQRFYIANWSLLPNIAMDALLVPLARVVPIYLLGKLFVVAILLLFVAGTYALRWVLWGRIGIWPAAVLLVVYNSVLAWGFLNYLFGAGLAMLCLAAWIWARDRCPWRWLVPASALAALVLFFSHLFALGLYALSVAGFEFGRSLRLRGEPLHRHFLTWALGGLQFLLPIAFSLQSSTVSESGLTFFGELETRISVGISTASFHYNAVDAGILFFLTALLLGGCFLRMFKLRPEMKLPLLVLLIAAMAMPSWLFGSWAAHIRLAPVVIAMTIAATDLQWRQNLFCFIMPVMAACLLALRIFDTAEIVQRHDAMVNELREVLAQSIPEGSSLLVAIDLNGPVVRNSDWSVRPWLHFGALAVIDRSVFLPTLFTDPSKQPLVVTSQYRDIDTPFAPPVTFTDLRSGADGRWSDQMFGQRDRRGSKYYWAHWPRIYDTVLILETKSLGNPDPHRLKSVNSGSFFSVYHIQNRHL